MLRVNARCRGAGALVALQRLHGLRAAGHELRWREGSQGCEVDGRHAFKEDHVARRVLAVHGARPRRVEGIGAGLRRGEQLRRAREQVRAKENKMQSCQRSGSAWQRPRSGSGTQWFYHGPHRVCSDVGAPLQRGAQDKESARSGPLAPHAARHQVTQLRLRCVSVDR